MCANRNGLRFRFPWPPVPSAPCRATLASTAICLCCVGWQKPSPCRLGMDSQPSVPQNFGQSQIEWNRLARGPGLAVPNVLHDDRANDMDLHLLKIDVLPLEA